MASESENTDAYYDDDSGMDMTMNETITMFVNNFGKIKFDKKTGNSVCKKIIIHSKDNRKNKKGKCTTVKPKVECLKYN